MRTHIKTYKELPKSFGMQLLAFAPKHTQIYICLLIPFLRYAQPISVFTLLKINIIYPFSSLQEQLPGLLDFPWHLLTLTVFPWAYKNF